MTMITKTNSYFENKLIVRAIDKDTGKIAFRFSLKIDKDGYLYLFWPDVKRIHWAPHALGTTFLEYFDANDNEIIPHFHKGIIYFEYAE